MRDNSLLLFLPRKRKTVAREWTEQHVRWTSDESNLMGCLRKANSLKTELSDCVILAPTHRAEEGNGEGDSLPPCLGTQWIIHSKRPTETTGTKILYITVSQSAKFCPKKEEFHFLLKMVVISGLSSKHLGGFLIGTTIVLLLVNSLPGMQIVYGGY